MESIDRTYIDYAGIIAMYTASTDAENVSSALLKFICCKLHLNSY